VRFVVVNSFSTRAAAVLCNPGIDRGIYSVTAAARIVASLAKVISAITNPR
jgi:hypothetical protein